MEEMNERLSQKEELSLWVGVGDTVGSEPTPQDGRERASTHRSWAGPHSLLLKGLLQKPHCHSNSQTGRPGTHWAHSPGPGAGAPGGPMEEVGDRSSSWGLWVAWERMAGRGTDRIVSPQCITPAPGGEIKGQENVG